MGLWAMLHEEALQAVDGGSARSYMLNGPSWQVTDRLSAD